MTLEEAKKLKPGDRILIEAIVRGHETRGTIDPDGDVRISFELSRRGTHEWAFIKPEAIREKIVPPRRKFRKGDIVKDKSSGIYYDIAKDENDEAGLKDHIAARPSGNAEYKSTSYFRIGVLTLVCAVEDRSDRREEA